MMEEQSRRHGAVTVGWSGQRGRRAMSRLGITLVVVTGACTQSDRQRALSVGSTTQEGPTTQPGPAAQEKQVALVVGNSKYHRQPKIISPLRNPVNDAEDIADVLKDLNFCVTKLLDASSAKLREKLKIFGRESKGAAIALVFYAGHGTEADGVNSLLGVDAKVHFGKHGEEPVVSGDVGLKQVLDATAGAQLQVVILDACRNPPRRGLRSVGNGMFGTMSTPKISDPKGTLVAYSTAAGTVASDGPEQPNSPYTAALLKELKKPQEVLRMFKEVARQVRIATHGQQIPAVYQHLEDNYYFAGKPDDREIGVDTSHPVPNDEMEFWRFIMDELNKENWRYYVEYIRQYPEGRYKGIAKIKLKSLEDRTGHTTPLHVAVGEENAEAVKILLWAEADVSAVDPQHHGQRPLHVAVQNGAADIVRMLLKAKANVSAADSSRWTPLHEAVNLDKHADIVQDIVRTLLKARANVSAKTIRGWTPLHIAAEKMNADIVRMLLEHRADVSAKDNHGWTPLHAAAQRNTVDVGEVLLEFGADVFAVDRDGQTPLHDAGQNENADIARMLLEHRADVSARDRNGETPLFEAAWTGSTDTARVLLDAGASRKEVPEAYRSRLPKYRDEEGAKSVSAPNRDEEGAESVSARSRDEDAWKSASARNTPEAFLAYLREYPSGRFAESARRHLQKLATAKAWLRVAKTNNVELAGALLEAGVAVDAKDPAGNTPLHRAAYNNAEKVARVLLEAGADVDARDTFGDEPLHQAAYNNAEKVARMLLEAGADVDARNEGGATPLHQAADTNNVEAMRVLLEAGADVDARNKLSMTPLYWAVFSKNTEMARMLLEAGASRSALPEKSIATGFRNEHRGSMRLGRDGHRGFRKP